ncbi:hypothetical protein ACOZ38_29645 [Sphaerisporangium viridialbum]|uniref:SbtR family transcriptional regulator n=1 Tax=Sphaerisporangium viridialbum TaxID=46189 RepID=UPI003C76064F
MRRLTKKVDVLSDHGDPETALFTFFTRMVEEAVEKKTVADLLSGVGIDMRVANPVQTFQEAIGALPARAQHAGTVRQEIRLDEVIALLTATCQAALHAGWDPAAPWRSSSKGCALACTLFRATPSTSERSAGRIMAA